MTKKFIIFVRIRINTGFKHEIQMFFRNQQDKNIALNILKISDNVTEAEIKVPMNLIFAKSIFTSLSGNLVTLMEANIISRNVQKITVR